MKDDPIVAGVRAVRDELAAQCGFDLKKYFGNYGNYKPARGGSTFAIRPAGSSPPKTGERPNEMTRTDEQRSRRTMLTVHNHLGDNVKKVFLV